MVVASMCAGQLADMLARGWTVALTSRLTCRSVQETLEQSGDCKAAVEGGPAGDLFGRRTEREVAAAAWTKGAAGATHRARRVSL